MDRAMPHSITCTPLDFEPVGDVMVSAVSLCSVPCGIAYFLPHTPLLICMSGQAETIQY